MISRKKILEVLDEKVVIDILLELGSPCTGMGYTSSGGKYLTFRTICHHGDSEDKLWFYEDTKIFQCWTCCGNMSIFDLVMKIQSCSFSESVKYVANKLGLKFSSNRQGIQDSEELRFFLGESDRLAELLETRQTKSFQTEISQFYDATILKYFDDNTFYQGWINEGITERSMKKFKISFNWLDGHIIIPHFNDKGQLVGVRRRSLNPEDSKNKYMPEYIKGIFYDHPLGLNLYGLWENQEAIMQKKAAIIVEGEKSVLLSDSYYDKNSIAVATCGFNISNWQIKKLKSLKVNTVYLCFDKDFDLTLESEYKKDPVVYNQFIHYKERLQVLSQRLATFFKVYLVYDRKNLLKIKDSPLDRGQEVFEQLLSSSKIIKES